MIIQKNINGSKWEIEFFTDYKHKSKPVDWSNFTTPLRQCVDYPGLMAYLEKAKNLPEGMVVTTKDINIAEADLMPEPMLPMEVIIELAKMFSVDPRFPVDIKMKHNGERFRIHFKKDGSMTLRHRFNPNHSDPSPEPEKLTKQHDRHWL